MAGKGWMDGSMIDAMVAPVSAAAGAYGTAVLTRGENAAADATLRLGQRILARLCRHPQVGSQISEAAARPDAGDAHSLLRVLIAEAVGTDQVLADDLRGILTELPAPAGSRRATIGTNNGIVSLGDNAHNTVR
jgi:hypothetical protein